MILVPMPATALVCAHLVGFPAVEEVAVFISRSLFRALVDEIKAHAPGSDIVDRERVYFYRVPLGAPFLLTMPYALACVRFPEFMEAN